MIIVASADNLVPLFETPDLVSKLVCLLDPKYGVQCEKAAGALWSLAVAADNQVPLFMTRDLVSKLDKLFLGSQQGCSCYGACQEDIFTGHKFQGEAQLSQAGTTMRLLCILGATASGCGQKQTGGSWTSASAIPVSACSIVSTHLAGSPVCTWAPPRAF